MRTVVPERRARRHSSRAEQTYLVFLHRLQDLSGFTEQQAEDAAIAVLCALEQRLFGREREKLESQLPSKLRDLVHHCALHRGAFPRKFDRHELIRLVAEAVPPGTDAERATRTVFHALRDQISEGEAEHVAAQLPADMVALWRLPP